MHTTITASRKRAVSLIEGVLYLVIAIFVVVGSITMFKQVQRNQERLELSRMLTVISQGIRELYHDQPLIDEVDITLAMAKSGHIPGNYIYVDPADGITKISYPGSNRSSAGLNQLTMNGFGATFVIDIYDVSPETCTYFLNINEEGSGPAGHNILGIELGYLSSGSQPTRFTGDPNVHFFPSYSYRYGSGPADASDCVATNRRDPGATKVLSVYYTKDVNPKTWDDRWGLGLWEDGNADLFIREVMMGRDP